MAPVLQARKLTKAYDKETVLRDIDIAVEAGSIHAVVGPNGAGKSTLLKVAVGLILPTAGSVDLFGRPIDDAARARIYYVNPEVQPYPMFRVKDVIAYTRLLYPSWDEGRCAKLVAGLQLPLNKTVRQLSLGMKMRLRIALALASQVDLLLLDEATNGVDPFTKEQIMDLLLQETANRNLSILMTTHQLADVERIADTVTVLHQGAVVAAQSLVDLPERFREVHASLPAGEAEQLSKALHALDYSYDKGRAMILTAADLPAIHAALALYCDARYADIRPVSLDKWLTAMLKKEGASGGKISLSSSAPI